MRSDLMKQGYERAPHRSLFKAMGYTDEEIARPMIGVVNSYNEIIPGHIHLNMITQDVKAGIRMAGGTPIEFPAIGICDGIAMGHTGMKYSLASRELIADSVEVMAMAHAFDGLALVAHLYNTSARRRGGKTEAIYNSKSRPDSAAGMCVTVMVPVVIVRPAGASAARPSRPS